MTTFSRFLVALAFIAAASASAQNWTKAYPYAQWNSTGNDFMHAPSLVPGDVLFVSDRSDFDHGKIPVKRCGSFSKPYSVFRGHGQSVSQIKDLGTERWAGVPVYNRTKNLMAVPQWMVECSDGVAGIELLLYSESTEQADLQFEGKNWKLISKASKPQFSVAQNPVFHPEKSILIFSGEQGKHNADLYSMDLLSSDFVITPLEQTMNTPSDEVYPTFWGDSLFFSRKQDISLNILGSVSDQFFALPEVTNSEVHDFNLWLHSQDSAWINTRRGGNQTDLWVLVNEKPIVTEPLVEETTEPEIVAPVFDELIFAGKFTSGSNAERRAAQLTKLPELDSQVSVEYDGKYYVIVVHGKEGQSLLPVVQSKVPDAFAKQIERSSNTLELEIYFDFDSYEIRNGEAQRIRAFLAQIDNLSGTFELTGHCDARGTTLYNLNLGLNRAKSVKSFVKNVLGQNIESHELSRSEWDLQEQCPDGVKCPDAKHERNRRVVLRFTK